MSITRFESNNRMSQAVIHNGIVYLAGQVGNPGDPFADQVKTVLSEIDRLLAEAGTSKSKILSATIWLPDMADFATLNDIWEKWVDPANPPARATGQVALVSADYKIEIIVVAAVD